VPDQVRIPCFVIISAGFSVLAGILLNAYLPSWGRMLESFIPMLALSSLVLGRMELYARRRTIVDSAVDAIGMGLGYLFVLMLLGSLREILGSGSLFGRALHFHHFQPMSVFLLAPGGLFLLGLLAALFRKLSANMKVYSDEENGGQS
jgi:electron transport complex protein RnfE